MKHNIRGNSLNITIDEQFDGRSVSDFLAFFRVSAKNINALLTGKQLSVNRTALTDDSCILNKGDTLTINLPQHEVDYAPADRECPVIYEDDFVFIAHKEAGIIVHDDERTDCLANQAAAYLLDHGISAPVRYIHRLDKETSGLVLFVKIPLFQPYYDYLLKEKLINRKYLAITDGKGKVGQKFTFRQNIGKDRHVNNRYRVSASGKEAVTKARIISKYKDHLLFECTLLTGRTHQIRVHLSHNHFRIVNDDIYGIPSKDFHNMGLWAYQLQFPDIMTGNNITVRDIRNSDYDCFRLKDE